MIIINTFGKFSLREKLSLIKTFFSKNREKLTYFYSIENTACLRYQQRPEWELLADPSTTVISNCRAEILSSDYSQSVAAKAPFFLFFLLSEENDVTERSTRRKWGNPIHRKKFERENCNKTSIRLIFRLIFGNFVRGVNLKLVIKSRHEKAGFFVPKGDFQ